MSAITITTSETGAASSAVRVVREQLSSYALALDESALGLVEPVDLLGAASDALAGGAIR